MIEMYHEKDDLQEILSDLHRFIIKSLNKMGLLYRVRDRIRIYSQNQYLFKKKKSLTMLKDRAKWNPY